MTRLLLSVTLVAWALSMPGAAAQDVVTVDLGGLYGDFDNLQDGIDAVSDGGTVYVFPSYPDAYRGPRNRGLDFGGKNVTLWSIGGSDETLVDCEGLDRAVLLSAANDSSTLIAGFTFMNGAATDGGGAIRCEGDPPVLSDCIFRGNSAPLGGALWFASGTTRIVRCGFFDNSAPDGAALYASSAVFSLRSSSFHGNTSAGATVAVVGSDVAMSTCTVAGNAADTGIRLDGSTAVIEQCVLAFNGPGTPVEGASLEIFHCCVFGNTGGDDLPGNAHDNEFSDPLLCDLEGGILSLCSNSTCLPSLNPWGLQVGSKAQGCLSCDSPVETSSWGRVKAIYRTR